MIHWRKKNKLDFIKIKNFVSDIVKRVKRWAADWKNNLCKTHIWERSGIQNIQRTPKSQQWVNEQPNQKMDKRPEQTPHQRRYADGK